MCLNPAIHREPSYPSRFHPLCPDNDRVIHFFEEREYGKRGKVTGCRVVGAGHVGDADIRLAEVSFNEEFVDVLVHRGINEELDIGIHAGGKAHGNRDIDVFREGLDTFVGLPGKDLPPFVSLNSQCCRALGCSEQELIECRYPPDLEVVEKAE